MIQTMRRYARLYMLIEAQYIKARMQYRADFIISSVGMIFTNVVSLAVFWVLFQTIPELAGWSYYEILFIYGFYLLAVSPAQIFFDHIWQLRVHVQEGTFIKYYFRPMNMLFYYLSEMFDLKGVSQVLVGIGLLIYTSIQLGLTWSVGRIALMLITLVSGSLVIASLLTLSACSAFWIINSYPVLALAFRLREFSQYPTTIFNGIFRFIFTYIIPIGFVAFYPSQLLLRPDSGTWVLYLSPFIGLATFALAYAVWVRGVNTYTGTGS